MDNETIYDNLEGHPEQPGPKLPRPIVVSHPLTAVSSGCLIIFGLVWTAIILILLTIIVLEFMPELQAYWLLRNTGVATTAEVIDHGLIIPQGDRAKPFYLTYRYTAPLPQGDSQQFTRKVEIDIDTFNRLPQGTLVPIIYSATDPAVSRLQSEFNAPWQTLDLGVTAFLTFFLLIGLLVIGLGLWNARHAWALSRRGELTQGVIYDRWIVPRPGDRPPEYCVAYYFDLPWLGSHSRISRAEFNKKAYRVFEVGDTVQIRYLPEKPQICRLELE